MLPQNIKIWRARSWFARPKHLLVICLLLLLNSPTATAWRQLAPGLDYEALKTKLTPWSRIHVFRIDLSKYSLSLATAADLSLISAPVETYANYHKAILAINGGFFDTSYKPLGLRINQQKQKSPLKQVSWWGVFSLKGSNAEISSASNFDLSKDVDLAIQSGPRLLINGKIPKLKPGKAARSAICIRKDGKIIILATENAAISTHKLAKILSSTSLNCVSALNLDGGNSTQLQAKIGNFSLNVHGFSPIADVIMIKNKF